MPRARGWLSPTSLPLPCTAVLLCSLLVPHLLPTFPLPPLDWKQMDTWAGVGQAAECVPRRHFLWDRIGVRKLARTAAAHHEHTAVAVWSPSWEWRPASLLPLRSLV